MKSFAGSDSLFASFGEIANLARELNISMAVPEIVLVGGDDASKAQFVEQLLGVNLGKAATRPLVVQTTFVASATTARATLKRDRASASPEERVALTEVAQAVARRMCATDEPLYVSIEFNQCWNIAVIDMPALQFDAVADANALQFCQNSRRTIVGIEKADDWDKMKVADFVRQADAKNDRSLFVYTEFAKFIAASPGTRELNQWLNKAAAAASSPDKVHFVTLGDDADALYAADMELLEQMQYDLSYERCIGVSGARKSLLDTTFRQYQEFVPAVLKTLRSLRADSIQNHQRTQAQIRSMDSFKLRAVANQFVMNFLQTIERLCVGTLEGVPTINGQTSVEERAACGIDWRNADFKTISVDKKWSVNGADAKLYGGQQFERLLSEFRALIVNTSMPALSQSEVAVAAGPVRATGAAPNLAWAASELARRAVERSFLPLIDQLFDRMVFVLERQLVIAERILEAKRKAKKQQKSTSVSASGGLGLSSGGMGLGLGTGLGVASPVAAAAAADDSAVSNVNDFPFFTSAVKSFYLDVVHALAERTRSKCLDEFQCTQLIDWQGGMDEKKLPSSKKKDDAKETLKSVTALSTQLFDDIKQRLADNIVLKCHSSFLVPISEHLYGEIQGKISQLTDQDMDALFEVKVTTARLKREEVQLAAVTKRFEAMEQEFMSATEKFRK